jgi:hypothetical protein
MRTFERTKNVPVVVVRLHAVGGPSCDGKSLTQVGKKG